MNFHIFFRNFMKNFHYFKNMLWSLENLLWSHYWERILLKADASRVWSNKWSNFWSIGRSFWPPDSVKWEFNSKNKRIVRLKCFSRNLNFLCFMSHLCHSGKFLCSQIFFSYISWYWPYFSRNKRLAEWLIWSTRFTPHIFSLENNYFSIGQKWMNNVLGWIWQCWLVVLIPFCNILLLNLKRFKKEKKNQLHRSLFLRQGDKKNFMA